MFDLQEPEFLAFFAAALVAEGVAVVPKHKAATDRDAVPASVRFFLQELPRGRPPRRTSKVLASLHLDAGILARFLADPASEGPRLGLGSGPFDLVGITFAARSFAAKRASIRP